MNRSLLLIASFSLFSQMCFSEELAAQNSDEDSFNQPSSATIELPTQTETSSTISAQSQSQAEAAQAAEAPAPSAPKLASVENTTLNTMPSTRPDPIDVDAVYRNQAPAPAPRVVKRPMTEAEKMKIMRARLEQQNEILMRKKIETMRLRQEMEMSKRIQKTFEDSMKKMDKIE